MFDEPGIRYTHQAMRTTFEFFFPGPSPSQYQGIAEDCANELTDIELAISPYQEGSDIHRLNCASGTDEWVRIGWPTYTLLKLCQSLMITTNGAFSPFDGKRTMRVPGKVLDHQTSEILSQLDDSEIDLKASISFQDDSPLARLAPGHIIDLGAIGKGWALDKCAALARDAGIERAFFHSGGSSMLAIGSPWPVTIPGTSENLMLSDTAMSVSRRINPDAGGVHIVSQNATTDQSDVVARVIGVSCAVTDAISTAAIVDRHSFKLLDENIDIKVITLPSDNI
jgi:thiamine biosynthesis lipoprotein